MKNQANNTKALIPLLILVLIDSMGVGLIFPILSPLFMRTSSGLLPATAPLGERDLFYALSLGIFCVFMFIAAPFMGDISDRLGRKKTLLLCLFGTAFSSWLSAFSINITSIGWLLVSRVIAGLMAGSEPIAQAAILDLSTKQTKTKNLGLMAFVGCVGFVVGPIVGGVFSDKQIVSWFNYDIPFYIDAALAIFNGILLIFTFTETNVVKQKFHFVLMRCVYIFKDAFTNTLVRKLSIVFFLYELSWSIYFQYISVYLVQKYNFTSADIGIFMAYIGFVLALAFLIIIRILLNFFHERIIALYSIFICGIFLFFPILFPQLNAQWLIVIPTSLTSALTYNTMLALFSNSVSEEQQGWVMGVSTAVLSVSWILGSALTGLLDYISIYAAFIASGILMLLAGIVLKV